MRSRIGSVYEAPKRCPMGDIVIRAANQTEPEDETPNDARRTARDFIWRGANSSTCEASIPATDQLYFLQVLSCTSAPSDALASLAAPFGDLSEHGHCMSCQPKFQQLLFGGTAHDGRAFFLGVHPKHGPKRMALPRNFCLVAALFVDHFNKGLRNGCFLALVWNTVQAMQPQNRSVSMFRPPRLARVHCQSRLRAVVGVRAPS